MSSTKVEISLVHKYETNFFNGDYSRGTFFEGSIFVPSDQLDDIVKKFQKTGEIELYAATDRYLSRKKSEKVSKFRFMNPDPANNFDGQTYSSVVHPFGTGFIHYDTKYGYTYFYWLEISLNYDDSPNLDKFSEYLSSHG